mgnify:CR=1 FL=1
MKLVSIETIPGQEFEALDIVRGTVVYSKNFGRDFMAGMKTLVGGEITGYTEMLVEARQIATKRMVDAAEALGADAVVGLRYASASVMQGAAEVIAYGDMIKYGSVNAAKEKGQLRSEGKEYVVQDGDIILFRFNV